jgi:hypothetical protein
MEITWPGGAKQIERDVAVDRVIAVRERGSAPQTSR